MTRYFAGSAATRKTTSTLSTGFTDEAAARAQAEFLAGYGGVAKVSTNTGEIIAKFSIKRGWH